MRKQVDERGSALILVALALTVLVGFAGLAVDAGRLYIERQRLQTIADAAALAGARQLPDSRQQAATTALAMVRANQPTPLTTETADVAADNLAVTVRLARPVPLTLIRLLGLTDVQVGVTATAQVGKVGAVTGALPLGVEAQDFETGRQYTLKLPAPGQGGKNQRGNFNALALGGTGANVYRENLRSGYDGWLSVGDEVLTEPGNMKGPTEQGLAERLAADPDSTWDQVPAHSPRRLLIPIVESFDVPGRKPVKIVGFAIFFLEQFKPSGEVVGRFLEAAVTGRPQEWDDTSGTAKVVFLSQ